MRKTENLIRTYKTVLDLYTQFEKDKGEYFNLFETLGILKEEKYHSLFIADLLNPKGSHKMGDIFLRDFLKVIKQENYLEHEQKIHVQTEKYLGQVNNKAIKGGFADIYININGREIVIENKIYSGEGHKQLERYKNSVNSECLILYLTLNGDKSNFHKTFNDYQRLSYKEHILNWLILCKKEAVNVPSLRSAITQYKNTIKKLTNQHSNKEMDKTLKEILKGNLDIAKSIHDTYKNIEAELIEKQVLLLIDIINTKNFDLDKKNITRSRRSDSLFVPLKTYDKEELGVQIELGNDYYFFTVAHLNKIRYGNGFNKDRFNTMKVDLKAIEQQATKSYAIAIPSNNTIGITKGTYHFPEANNTEAFKKLANRIAEFRDKLNK